MSTLIETFIHCLFNCVTYLISVPMYLTIHPKEIALARKHKIQNMHEPKLSLIMHCVLGRKGHNMKRTKKYRQTELQIYTDLVE